MLALFVLAVAIRRIGDKTASLFRRGIWSWRNYFTGKHIRTNEESTSSQNFWIMLGLIQMLHMQLLLRSKIRDDILGQFLHPVNFCMLHFSFISGIKFIDDFRDNMRGAGGDDETTDIYMKMKMLGYHGTNLFENYIIVFIVLFAIIVAHVLVLLVWQ